MNKRGMRVLRRWAAAVVCALLACSCIDGREEFWLEADGSGRAEVHYQVPAAVAALQGGKEGIREILGHLLAANGHVFSEASHDVRSEGGVLHIHLRVAFASALDLGNIEFPPGKIPLPVKHFAGEFELSQEGRLIGLRRTVNPGKGLPGNAFMPASQFKDKRLVYIIHLPAPALESNATRTEDDGLTLIWDHALAAELRRPLVLSLEVEAPLPSWIIPSAMAAAFLLAGVFALMIRRVGRGAAGRASN